MIPTGWLQHPSAPQYMYNPQTQEVLPIPAAPPAPPAYPAAPVAQAPQPQAVPQGDWGVSMEVINAEREALRSRSFVRATFLDFDKLSRPGQESKLKVRIMPPAAGKRAPWLHTVQHRLPAALVPDAGDRSYVYVDSYNREGGPGNCPVAEAINKISKSGDAETPEVIEGLRGRPKFYWQVLDMNDPQSHYTQKDGQWVIVPKVLRISKSLHACIVNNLADTDGRLTFPDVGTVVTLIKEKTGPHPMNVDYRSVLGETGPLPAELMSAYSNLIDLETLLYARSPAEMEQIAQNILAYAQSRGIAVGGFTGSSSSAMPPAAHSIPPQPVMGGQPAAAPWTPPQQAAPPPAPAYTAPPMAPPNGTAFPPPVAPGIAAGVPLAPAGHGVAPPPGMPAVASMEQQLSAGATPHYTATPSAPPPPPPGAAPPNGAPSQANTAPPAPVWDPATGTPF